MEIVVQVGAADLQHLAHQRVAVGVGAGGGEADDRITLCDLAAVDDLAFFHDTDTEAGEIVVVALVHARHLGCFAAA